MVSDGRNAGTTPVFANDFLDSDMTKSELISALEMLLLKRPNSTCLVVVDKGVVEYLLGRLAS